MSRDYSKYDLRKKKKSNKIWWVEIYDERGAIVFTFDKKTFFNLFRDFPHKITKEQIEIFEKEEPFWANFFKYRIKAQQSYKPEL